MHNKNKIFDDIKLTREEWLCVIHWLHAGPILSILSPHNATDEDQLYTDREYAMALRGKILANLDEIYGYSRRR